METSLQEYLSRQLFTGGADLITKRVLKDILKFNQSFGFGDATQWRDQLVAITDMIHQLGNGLSVIEAVLLAIMEDRWQQFDIEWRNMYQDDFEVYVWRKYQRKPGTIRADLRAVRIFLLNDKAVKPFGTLELPKRDITGEILKDDNGKLLTERVEWDPTQTTLAKLKVAVPLVEQNKITPKVWSMLADDHVSSSQMVKTIYTETQDDPHPPQLVIKYRLQGPVLVAYENGNEVEICELNFEQYYEEPYSLKHRALDKLMAALGLTLDEHVTLYKEAEEINNGYYSDDEGTKTTTGE